MTLQELTSENIEITSDGLHFYVQVLPDGEKMELREFMGRMFAASKLVRTVAEMRQMQNFFYAEREKGIFVKSALNHSKRLAKEVDYLLEKTVDMYVKT